jgi:hypothetical protein
VVSHRTRYWVLCFFFFYYILMTYLKFADDTSIIVTDINELNFEINLKQTFRDINTWFTSNLLALNFDKTQYMEFRPMNYYNVTTKVNYEQISLTNVNETKFHNYVTVVFLQLLYLNWWPFPHPRLLPVLDLWKTKWMNAPIGLLHVFKCLAGDPTAIFMTSSSRS